ncbi:MAG: InlB B-repeat-containing protein [Bacteroidales bacterium]|nr:InlB B-repeat-containing protein [Bacteroidales bacterium]
MAENYGQQLGNSDFELWENDGGTLNEPVNWSSFATAKTNFLTGSAKTAKQLEFSSEIRPGSKGEKSAKVMARTMSILGSTIVANGNMTTGQINAEGLSTTAKENHNATRPKDAKFHQVITSFPDSFSVWVKYNGADEARVAALLHEDAGVKDPYDVHADTKGSIVTSAEQNYTSNGNVWQRLSIPFSKKEGFNGTVPKYMLVTFGTNKTPGSGAGTDVVLVDDALLIYNPVLSAQSITPASVGVTASTGAEVSVKYTLEGTMSPYNVEAEPNKVKLQISNAEGDFPADLSQNIIGVLQTDVSGTIKGVLPAAYPFGSYKLRVLTTNYPMIDNAGIQTLKVSMGYDLSITKNIEEAGTVEGAGTYASGENVQLKAIPSEGYRFVKWTNAAGDSLSNQMVYSYTIGAENVTLTANFVQQHTLGLIASPVEVGTVTGNGIYDRGTAIEIKAEPSEGYRLLKWTNTAGDSLSDKATYTYTVLGDEILTAHFVPLIYSVSLSKNIETGGEVEGASDYAYGSTAILKAIPSEGYKFVKWTDKDGNLVSSDAEFSYKVEARDILFNANFEILRFDLTLQVNDPEMGRIEGGGTFDYGTIASLTAIPNVGYGFVKWTNAAGDSLSDKTVYSYKVEENETLTAHFVSLIYSVSLSKNIEAGGEVEGASDYEYGSTAILKAIPSEGYKFVKWTDKDGNLVSSDAEFSYKVQAGDTLFSANFEILRFKLTLQSNDTYMGNVGDGGTYEYGTVVPLTAMPNAGYRLEGWFNEKEEKLTLTPEGGYKVTKEELLTARFIDNEKVSVTLSSNLPEGVVLSGAGQYNIGLPAEIRAEVKTGYIFVKWIGVDSNSEMTENPYSFTAEADSSFIAYLEKQTYEVQATVNSENAGAVKGSGIYPYKEEIRLEAVPAEGYRFVNWTDLSGMEISNASVLEYTVVDNYEVVANFEIIKVSLSLSSVNEAYGKVNGSGECNYGDELSIEAVPEKGYRFAGWYNDADQQLVSSNPVESIVMKQDMVLIAYFEQDEFDVVVGVNEPEYGNASGGGRFLYGTETEMRAIPNEGYKFVNWTTQSGNVLSTDNPYTYTVTYDENILVANFAVCQYLISVEKNDDSAGSVTGEGLFDYGTEHTLTAVPAEGYKFIEWTLNGVSVSSDSEMKITVTGEVTYKAHFGPNVSIGDNIADNMSVFSRQEFIELRGIPEGTMIQIVGVNGAYKSFESSTEGDMSVPVSAQGTYIIRLSGYWGEKNIKVYVTR